MSENNTQISIIERLFNAGAHFGFTKRRRHPSVIPYLFGNKGGTDIFDLEKTQELIEQAKAVLTEAGKSGKTVLFVGTKTEASKLVKKYAEKAEAPYVTNRWIGGILTNFTEIRKRISRLLKLIDEGETGELDRKYTKRERVIIGREVTKLQFNFGGISKVEKLPNLLLIVDPRHDSIALQEANDLNIPTIGIMSSDNNATKVTYPVLVNDAVQASIDLVLSELADAYIKGKSAFVPQQTKSVKENTPKKVEFSRV